MIGSIGLAEHRETLGMLFPREFAAVDDDSAECRAMPTHELRERMHHNVCAMLDGTQQDWRGDRIVDDQRHAVFMSHGGESLNVANVSRGIANSLAKDCPRFGVDQLFDIVGTI